MLCCAELLCCVVLGSSTRVHVLCCAVHITFIISMFFLVMLCHAGGLRHLHIQGPLHVLLCAVLCRAVHITLT